MLFALFMNYMDRAFCQDATAVCYGDVNLCISLHADDLVLFFDSANGLQSQ